DPGHSEDMRAVPARGTVVERRNERVLRILIGVCCNHRLRPRVSHAESQPFAEAALQRGLQRVVVGSPIEFKEPNLPVTFVRLEEGRIWCKIMVSKGTEAVEVKPGRSVLRL